MITSIKRGRLQGSLFNGVPFWLEAFLGQIIKLKIHLQLYARHDVGQGPRLLRLLSIALRPSRPKQDTRPLSTKLILRGCTFLA